MPIFTFVFVIKTKNDRENCSLLWVDNLNSKNYMQCNGKNVIKVTTQLLINNNFF